MESAPAFTQLVTAEQPIRRLRRLEVLVVICIVCFGSFAWRTWGHQKLFQETIKDQDEKMRGLADAIFSQKKLVLRLSESVSKSTKTVAEQIGELSGQLQTRQTQVDVFQSRLRGLEISLRSRQRAQPIQKRTIEPATAGPTSWAASPQHPHSHDPDTSLPMPDNTVAHHTWQGDTDYWLVSRMFSTGQRMVKVIPFGVNSLGVKVHNIEDGMDYVLTPTGQWTGALEQQ